MPNLNSAKKKRPSLEKRNARYGWIFVAPFILGVLLVFLPVVLESFQFSFSNIKPSTSGYELEFVGIDKYYYAFRVHPTFVQTLITNMGTFITQVPVIIFFSLFIAVVLNQKMHGRGIFRAIFFLPVILATGIVAKAEVSNVVMENMNTMSGIDTGAAASSAAMSFTDISGVLESMYIDSSIVSFISNLVNNIYDVVNRSGVQIILFLSGLQGISPALYESAQIEGATGWESFWKITFPMISPIIFVNLIYSIVDLFTRSDNPVMTTISNVAFSSVLDYGASSAMAWVYFVIIAVILGLVSLLCYRLVFYQERD